MHKSNECNDPSCWCHESSTHQEYSNDTIRIEPPAPPDPWIKEVAGKARMAALGSGGHAITTTLLWLAGRVLWLAITGSPSTVEWVPLYFVSIPITLFCLWGVSD